MLIYGSEGVIHGYENNFNSFASFIHNLNRLITPLHMLKTEEEILEWMEQPNKINSKEYLTPLFKKSKIEDRLKGEIHEEFESHYT